MMQIQPGTGESLAIFQNTNPIVFVMFIYIFFDLSPQQRLDHRGRFCGYQGSNLHGKAPGGWKY